MPENGALFTLEERLNYQFSDPSLLKTALTHPSYGADHHTASYQRMEFLGDAVLELLISRRLYARAPELDEGWLTKYRAALVREETLSDIAKKLTLDKYILLSAGEERGGGREKPSILADVFEAVLAAVYLDGGTRAAMSLVEMAYKGRFDMDIDTFDPKTRLQELLHSRGHGVPSYQIVNRSGPDHAPIFTAAVYLDDGEIGRGSGKTKQAAQQEAAKAALLKFPKKS